MKTRKLFLSLLSLLMTLSMAVSGNSVVFALDNENNGVPVETIDISSDEYTFQWKNNTSYLFYTDESRTIESDLQNGNLVFGTRDENYNVTNSLVYDSDYKIVKYEKVSTSGWVTIEDVDFTQPGDYFAYIEGSGSYTGSCSIHFQIESSKDLSYNWNASISGGNSYHVGDADAFEEDLNAGKLEWYQYRNGESNTAFLIYDKDYKVDRYEKYNSTIDQYAEMSKEDFFADAGGGNVVLTGIGDYCGECYMYLNVVASNDIGNGEYNCEWKNNSFGTYYTDETRTLTSDLQSGNLVFGLYDDITYHVSNPLKYETDYKIDHYEKYDVDSLSYKEISDDSVNTVPGEYYAILQGLGSYIGTYSLYFKVDSDYDLSSYSISFGGDNTYYIGEDTTFDADLKASRIKWNKYRDGTSTSVSFTYGKEYELDHYEKKDPSSYEYKEVEAETVASTAGEYFAVVKGISPYTGTMNIVFTVADSNDLSYGWNAYLPNGNTYYIGEGNTFDDDLKANKVQWYKYRNGYTASVSFTYGTEYELDHYERKDPSSYEYKEVEAETVASTAGEYYAVLKGKDPYTGTRYLQFTVSDSNDISHWNAYISRSETYYIGEENTFEDDAKNNKINWSRNINGVYTSVSLIYGTDYEFDRYEKYDSNYNYVTVSKDEFYSEAGYGYAILKGKGNYTGEYRFYLTVADAMDISSNKYSLIWNNFNLTTYYMDESRTVETDLQDGYFTLGTYQDVYSPLNALTYGTDYVFDHYEKYDSASYNYTRVDSETVFKTVGQYNAILQGIAPYTGTRTISFQVVSANDISSYSAAMYRYGTEHDYHSGYSGYYIGEGETFEEDLKANKIQWYRYSDGSTPVSLVYGKDYTIDYYLHYVPSSSGFPEIKRDELFASAGYGYAVLKGIGDYEGEASIYISIADPKDLMYNYGYTWKNASSSYCTNESRTVESDLQKGNIIFGKYDDDDHNITTPLTYGTDYKIDHYEKTTNGPGGQPVEEDTVYSTPGQYCAVLKGIDPYSSTSRIYFTVVSPTDLSYKWGAFIGTDNSLVTTYYVGEGDVFENDLKAGKLEWYDYHNENGTPVSLKLGTDYEFVRYEKNGSSPSGFVEATKDEVFASAGTGYAIFKGIGNYTGEYRLYINVIDENSFDSLSYDFTNPTFYSYQTAPFTNRLRWYDSKGDRITLTEGVDYTVESYVNVDTGEVVTDADPVKYVYAHPGSYVMNLKGITYEGSKQVYIFINKIDSDKTLKVIQSITLIGESFNVYAGAPSKFSATVLINKKSISKSDYANIKVEGNWVEVELDDEGNISSIVKYSDEFDTFEEGKTYAYFASVTLDNSGSIQYAREFETVRVLADGNIYEAEMSHSGYGEGYLYYEFGPYVIKTCVKSGSGSGSGTGTSGHITGMTAGEYEAMMNQLSSSKSTSSNSSSTAVSANTSNSAGNYKSVDTSDSSNMLFYAITLTAGCVAIIGLVLYRRKMTQ